VRRSTEEAGSASTTGVTNHRPARGARRTRSSRRLIRRALVVLAGVALVGAVAPTASAKPPEAPATLAGESFSGVPTVSNEVCNPNGTSTFDYSVTGVASGPYAGTFTETGSVSVTPQTIEHETEISPVFGTLTYFSGFLASLDATFTIQSSAGTVTGTKTLALSGDGRAACQNTAELQSPIFGRQTVLIILRQAQTTGLAYSATLPADRRTYCDRGTSSLDLRGFGTADFGELEPTSFNETFSPSADSAARARGHKGCSAP
jgi:hypothetical protein